MTGQPSLLIFGATGQVATRLREQLGERYDITALDRAACDFATADSRKIDTILRAVDPALIINATGYTAVDKAESDEAAAYQVNAHAPGLIAAAAHAASIPFVHFSTDYVFDGGLHSPYGEGVRTSPINVYGASKRAGEELVGEQGGHIFRLQWVFDSRGRNFFLTMRSLLAQRPEMNIVADQMGAPSWAGHIAQSVAAALPLIADGRLPQGIYHLTAGGYTSWHGFACAIAAAMNSSTCIHPITTAEYPVPATRPKDTRLDCTRLAGYGISMPHWREGLAAAMAQDPGAATL